MDTLETRNSHSSMFGEYMTIEQAAEILSVLPQAIVEHGFVKQTWDDNDVIVLTDEVFYVAEERAKVNNLRTYRESDEYWD